MNSGEEMKSLLHLSASELKALNTIAFFLALDDFSGNIPQTIEADMIILAGHAVLPNIEALFNLPNRGIFLWSLPVVSGIQRISCVK